MKFKKIIEVILLTISSALFALGIHIQNISPNVSFEQLWISLQNSEGTSSTVIMDGLKFCLPLTIFLLLIICFILFYNNKKTITKLIFKLKKAKKGFSITIFPLYKNFLFTLIISLSMVIYTIISLGLPEYLVDQFSRSSIFEDYYIDPKRISLEFPNEKQNLIYIYIESMENSFADFINNGNTVNLIPNLEKIALENVSFSQNSALVGAYQSYGASWTAAALVSSTSGVPLKNSIALDGLTTIGDILEKEGYNQYFMMGSFSSFADRARYFTDHGNYKIYDVVWARENNKIAENYYENWGYEDSKLFSFAKEELLKIAETNEPFNFTILTADTHFPDGYLDKNCTLKYDYQYANVVNCSDEMISDFIEWVKSQDFYENTTIVLTGDHLSMQPSIKSKFINNERGIYNAIINSKVAGSKYKNRIFNSMDLFPTTLASLGVRIEGDKLGLGTNLFSQKKTLAEELGIEYMQTELKKNSNYYNREFLIGNGLTK